MNPKVLYMAREQDLKPAPTNRDSELDINLLQPSEEFLEARSCDRDVLITFS